MLVVLAVLGAALAQVYDGNPFVGPAHLVGAVEGHEPPAVPSHASSARAAPRPRDEPPSHRGRRLLGPGERASLQAAVARRSERDRQRLDHYGVRLQHCPDERCRRRLRRKMALLRDAVARRGRDLDRVLHLLAGGGGAARSRRVRALIEALLRRELRAPDPISLDLIDQEQELEEADVRRLRRLRGRRARCPGPRCARRQRAHELRLYRRANARRASLNRLIQRIQYKEV